MPRYRARRGLAHILFRLGPQGLGRRMTHRCKHGTVSRAIAVAHSEKILLFRGMCSWEHLISASTTNRVTFINDASLAISDICLGGGETAPASRTRLPSPLFLHLRQAAPMTLCHSKLSALRTPHFGLNSGFQHAQGSDVAIWSHLTDTMKIAALPSMLVPL